MLLVLLASGGCENLSPGWLFPADRVVEADSAIQEADNPLVITKVDQQGRSRPPLPPRVNCQLAVLHVLVPSDQDDSAGKIWNFLSEGDLDAELQLRLRANGLRVGVGHVRDWEPIRTALDAIEGHRVTSATPLSVPVGFPLSLELDAEPRDQTLFYVGCDGILSGRTWPQSRNVLRVTYAPDLLEAQRLRMHVVPEVHQRRKGWEWVRTEAGLWQVPRQTIYAFDAAAFVFGLDPGEFVLVAPSSSAQTKGLLGQAFLTRTIEARRYNSYVFLRPQARYLDQHD